MRRFISAPGLTIFFTYTLFISSTFTIAGQDASIVFLYLLGIYSLIRQRKWPDMSHPLLWMFLLFTAISLVSGIFNQYEVDTLMNLRNNWRFVFPFVLLTALSTSALVAHLLRRPRRGIQHGSFLYDAGALVLGCNLFEN